MAWTEKGLLLSLAFARYDPTPFIAGRPSRMPHHLAVHCACEGPCKGRIALCQAISSDGELASSCLTVMLFAAWMNPSASLSDINALKPRM